MSPGSDSDHPRTRRFVSYKCMFCHNGIPQIPAGSRSSRQRPRLHRRPSRRASTASAVTVPAAATCARVREPRRQPPQDVRASIVNPARLASKLRMEICMQCHLETSSGRIPATIVRFNRGPFSFLPGEPLDAFMLTFDHAPGTGHDDKFEAVSSVYRLRQSRCFLQEPGQADLRHLPQPAPGPARREAVAHRRESAAVPCPARARSRDRFADRVRQAYRVGGLHRVPHAETKGGGYSGNGDDGPSHSAPSARGKPARRIPRARRRRNTAARSCRITLRRCPQTPANALYLAVAQVGTGKQSAGRAARSGA